MIGIPYKELIDAIQTIEDFVINKRITDIKFTVTDDWDESSNLPVVDVTNEKGNEIFGDLNFESLEEAIIATAKGLVK